MSAARSRISIAQDGSTFANAVQRQRHRGHGGDPTFRSMSTFVAQAIDDQGGKSRDQTVSLTTFPLHVLQLGGKRPNGVFKFCMAGETGSNYMVLATTNIAEPSANWTPLGSDGKHERHLALLRQWHDDQSPLPLLPRAAAVAAHDHPVQNENRAPPDRPALIGFFVSGRDTVFWVLGIMISRSLSRHEYASEL